MLFERLIALAKRFHTAHRIVAFKCGDRRIAIGAGQKRCVRRIGVQADVVVNKNVVRAIRLLLEILAHDRGHGYLELYASVVERVPAHLNRVARFAPEFFREHFGNYECIGLEQQSVLAPEIGI